MADVITVQNDNAATEVPKLAKPGKDELELELNVPTPRAEPETKPAEDTKTVISLEEREEENITRSYVNKHGYVKSEEERIRKLETTYKILGPKEGISVTLFEEKVGIVTQLIKARNNAKNAIGKEAKLPESCERLDIMAFSDLAELIDHKKPIVNKTTNQFYNVNETFNSKPADLKRPQSVFELQHLIKEANSKKQRVRVVGAAHSWTPVFPEDGSVMVSLDNLKGIVHDVSGPQSEWTSTIGVGIKVRDVDDYLKQNDLCIPTNVVMNHVTFGGLITMGCHGTGWKLRTISDLCISMKLVDAHGELREFSLAKDGPRIWSALIVNLGLFGIVVEYTIRVVPSFNVIVRDYKRLSREFFGYGAEQELSNLVQTHHSTQIFWMPFNDKIWLKTFKETENPVNVPRVKYVRDTISNWFSMNFGVEFVDNATRAAPLTEEFMRLTMASFPDDYERVEKIYHAIHWEKFLDAIKINCMEFVFPIRADHLEDWAKVGECVRFVQRRTAELAQRKLYPFNLSLEMRFITNSDGLLSPAHGHEHTCFMEIVSTDDAVYWKEFSAEVALEWIRIFPTARPHWAKHCQHVPGIVDHIRDVYGENLQEFVKIRKELNVDPNNIFYTQWLGNIFEPSKFSPYVNPADSVKTNGGYFAMEPTTEEQRKMDPVKDQDGCCTVM